MPVGLTRKQGTLACLSAVLFFAVACLVAYHVHHEELPPNPSAPEAQVNKDDDTGKSAAPPKVASVIPLDGKDDVENRPAGNEPQMDPWLAGDGIKYDIQSPARPYGLDIVDRVQMAGSDEGSADFMTNTLPIILDYLKSNAVHHSSLELSSTEANRNNLVLDNPASVRIYFVGDAAMYHNSIGINFADDSGSMLVFPDASSPHASDGTGRLEYTSADEPLLAGDFVDLGAAETGSVLDFFIISDGAHEGTDAFSIDKTLNEDLISHARILGVVGDSVVVLGFEDMKNGGDHDYNDVIIAVDVGEGNLDTISASLGW